MRKRFLFLVMLSLSFVLIPNVTAADSALSTEGGVVYEENKFTNEECITDDSWTELATVDYELNQENGTYVLKGNNYSSLSDEEKNSIYIAYGVSSTGKTLYGYIPNYAERIQDEAIRDALSELEIITTSSCTGTLKVAKTIVGGEFDNDQEYLESQEYDDPGIKELEERNNTSDDSSNVDVDESADAYVDLEDDADDDSDQSVISKIIPAPNTASVISIVSIVSGSILLTFGVLILLKPDLVNKMIKNCKKKSFLFILAALLSISMGTMINGNANANEGINNPVITEVEKSEIEDLALTVKWDSQNIGSNYTVELVNETTGYKNRFSNKVKQYTYQGLELGKNYKVKIRVCTSERDEDCSDWSGIRERRYDRSLKAIILNYKDISLLEKNTVKLEVIQYIPKRTTDDLTVSWSSSNESVVSVDATGLVTAKGPGDAFVIATGANGVTATCNIHVTKYAIVLKSISLSKTSVSLKVGKTTTLKVTYNPNDTTDSKTVTWSSSKSSVASVNSAGKITAKKAGTATITAKTPTGKTATCKVTVTKATTTKKKSSSSSSSSSKKKTGSSSGSSSSSSSSASHSCISTRTCQANYGKNYVAKNCKCVKKATPKSWHCTWSLTSSKKTNFCVTGQSLSCTYNRRGSIYRTYSGGICRTSTCKCVYK